MSEPYYPVRLGLVCIVRALRPYGIYSAHTTRLAIAEREGLEYVLHKVHLNLHALQASLIYCEAHGIRFYRITSDLLPQWSNHRYSQAEYDLTPYRALFREIGRYAHDHGIRLTMHPGQKEVNLGSPRPEVVEDSVRDLRMHTTILQLLGHRPEHGSVLIVHGGGAYGDQEATLRRWAAVYHALPAEVRPYLSLENDEFTYGVEDLLPFCEEHGIPFCLDFFHNRVSDARVAIDLPLLQRIRDTWRHHGGIPKFHYSRQEPGERRGRHSETLDRLPRSILRIARDLQCPIDIMLEVKDKDHSIHRLHHRYFQTTLGPDGRQEHLLKEEYR